MASTRLGRFGRSASSSHLLHAYSAIARTTRRTMSADFQNHRGRLACRLTYLVERNRRENGNRNQDQQGSIRNWRFGSSPTLSISRCHRGRRPHELDVESVPSEREPLPFISELGSAAITRRLVSLLGSPELEHWGIRSKRQEVSQRRQRR